MWVQSVTVKEWKGASSKQEISKMRRMEGKEENDPQGQLGSSCCFSHVDRHRIQNRRISRCQPTLMMKVFWAMEHLACQPVYPLDTITKFTGFLVLVHVLDLFPDSCMSYRPFDNILKTIRITQDSNTSSSLGSREHFERTGLLIIMIYGEIRSHLKGQPSNHNSRRHISIWPSLNSITYSVLDWNVCRLHTLHISQVSNKFLRYGNRDQPASTSRLRPIFVHCRSICRS